jgi:hypothetical protein
LLLDQPNDEELFEAAHREWLDVITREALGSSGWWGSDQDPISDSDWDWERQRDREWSNVGV